MRRQKKRGRKYSNNYDYIVYTFQIFQNKNKEKKYLLITFKEDLPLFRKNVWAKIQNPFCNVIQYVAQFYSSIILLFIPFLHRSFSPPNFHSTKIFFFRCWPSPFMYKYMSIKIIFLYDRNCYKTIYLSFIFIQSAETAALATHVYAISAIMIRRITATMYHIIIVTIIISIPIYPANKCYDFIILSSFRLSYRYLLDFFQYILYILHICVSCRSSCATSIGLHLTV